MEGGKCGTHADSDENDNIKKQRIYVGLNPWSCDGIYTWFDSSQPPPRYIGRIITRRKCVNPVAASDT